MHRTTATLLTVALLFLAGLVLAGPAAACSCAGSTTAEQLARADTAFTGRLVSREAAGGSGSADPVLHVFSVDAVWKGTAHARQGVVSASSSASCGLELRGEGPFVVFARETDGRLSASLCGGTSGWSAQLEEEIRAVAGTQPRPPAAGEAGTEPPGGVPWLWLVLGAAALAVAGAAARRRAAG